jgi:hypothetical protein
MRERGIYCKCFGPFANTTIVIIEDYGESFRLSFDEGPEYDPSLLNNGSTAFKFLAGTIAEIRVTVLYGKRLSFHGTQIPTFGDAASKEATALSREAECMTIQCAEPWPCPDPAKPVLICPGGDYQCVSTLKGD